MKKLMYLLLAAVIILSLTACSGSSSSGPTASTPASESSTSGTASGTTTKNAGTKLAFWVPPMASYEMTDQEFWNDQVSGYKEKTGADISIEVIPWDNYSQKILTSFAGGSAPDLFSSGRAAFLNYIDSGLLAPLDDYFTKEELSEYLYPEANVVNGKLYGLRWLAGNATVLYCNMDILKASGFTEPPKTWDDLVQYGLKIKKDSPGIYPFLQHWVGGMGNLWTGYCVYLWQAGGDLFSSDGKLTLDSNAALEAAQFIYDMKNTHGILPESCISMTQDDVVEAMSKGNCAMAIMYDAKAKIMDEAGINWDYTSSLTNKTKAMYTSGDAFVMTSSSKDKELASGLLKYITSASAMENMHEKLYSSAPIKKGEKYLYSERFRDMYQDEYKHFKLLPAVKDSEAAFNELYANLQSMLLKKITPKEAMDNTMTYWETVVN